MRVRNIHGLFALGVFHTDMMCYTDWMTLVEKDDDNVAELWVQSDKHLWPPKKKLKVRFLDEIPGWRNERRGWINEDDILKIANEWHDCGVDAGKDVVPEFMPCGPDDTGDIRVRFIGNYYRTLIFLLIQNCVFDRFWESTF